MPNPDRFAPYALLLLRLVVGVAFVLHGYPKFQSLDGVVGFFGSLSVPTPGIMAPIVAVIETFGGLALIAGFTTRIAGVLLAVVMFFCTVLMKLPQLGFVAADLKAGAEFDLAFLAAALVIATVAPCVFAIDPTVKTTTRS